MHPLTNLNGSNQHFVKFCKEEHNIIKGCQTLHLGTLEYYRNLDPKFSIADSNEGVASTFGDKYGNKIVNSFLPENCYIFSLSKKDYEVSSNPFDKEYNSKYYLWSSSINNFIKRLGYLLSNTLTVEDLTEMSQKRLLSRSINDLTALNIRAKSDHVKYVDEKSFSSSITNTKSISDTIIFTKNQKYKNDEEFRIYFMITHPEIGDLSVKTSPKIINLNILDSVFSDSIPPQVIEIGGTRSYLSENDQEKR